MTGLEDLTKLQLAELETKTAVEVDNLTARRYMYTSDYSDREVFRRGYLEGLKAKSLDCKHPGCCCVCGHQGLCPEDGPCATGGTFE